MSGLCIKAAARAGPLTAKNNSEYGIESFMDQLPLIASLQLLAKRRDRAVVFFYGIFFVLVMTVAVVSFSPVLQRTAMRKFHFLPRPFAEWALTQFFPSMYNFHNEILLSSRLLPSDFREPRSPDQILFTVNHYPLRMIYFSLMREDVFRRMPVYVYTRTLYRGQEIVSSYMVAPLDRLIHIMLLNAYERFDR
jgi:hypothetical protein